jgi:hypothetical protein
MAVAGMPESSLRVARGENSRLAWAFMISLVVHLLTFGTYKAGQEFGWWTHLQWPSWLQRPRLLTEMLKQPEAKPPPEREIPLMFVDVSPAQATLEPPKDAKYYSAQNSIAANPEPDVSNVPKITGEQTDIIRTDDVPRPTPVPLQPTPPPPVEEPRPLAEELKAKPSEPVGDLALAKPEPPTPAKEPGADVQSRPRTIAEALARLTPPKGLVGKKMKQEGGVRRRIQIASLDAKGTEIGMYDYALVAVVEECWHLLLDQQHYASDYRGKVVLQFRLHHDGNVTDLQVVENTAGPIPGLICQTAVDKPKPFEKFPLSMRRMVGDTREIQFTFYYN